LQPISTGCTISTYIGGRKCEGRSARLTDKAHHYTKRVYLNMCFENQQTNGTVEDRCVRSTPQQSTTDLLDLTSESRSEEFRCIQPAMAEEGNVFVPTMEMYTTCYT
jgi:hypothetical protein